MTLDQVRRLKRLIIKRANGDEEDMSGPAPSENSVLEFIKRNPRPKDKKFHEWAEGKGVNVHKAEATAYGIISDLMNKGRSKGKHPAGVNRADVNKGVDIEAEHTPNKEIQRKITDDHNTELKKYYDSKKGLPAMEKRLEKLGVTFGRTPGKPMKISATLRRLKRFVTGAPRSQLRRIERKHQAQSVAHKFSGAARDLRGMARAGKMTLGAGRAMVQREKRPVIRVGKRVRSVGPAVTNFLKRNPEVVAMFALPAALVGGSIGMAALSKRLTKKKKKGLKKTAGPPTLAKLRRAYPKGKVKPPVANPGAPRPPEFPKAANTIGGIMDSMTKAFFFGLTDELEKAGKCGKPHDKKEKKGLVLGKKAMDDGAGSPTAMGASIKAKIQAAKADPSTKANPKDTGPKGSGLQDPRAQAMKGRGFGKGAGVLGRVVYKKITGKEKIPIVTHKGRRGLIGKGGYIVDTDKKKGKKGEKKPMKKSAEEAFFAGFAKEAWGGGKAKAVELNKHIQAAGGDVKKGVASYNAAKKKEKGFGKKAEEAFFGGFDEALGKDAATAIPKDTPGAAEARRVAAGYLKRFKSRTFRKTMEDPKGKMAKGYRGVLGKMYGKGMGKDAATAVAGPRGSGERKNVAGMLRSMRGIPRKPKAASKLRAALQRLKAKGK